MRLAQATAGFVRILPREFEKPSTTLEVEPAACSIAIEPLTAAVTEALTGDPGCCVSTLTHNARAVEACCRVLLEFRRQRRSGTMPRTDHTRAERTTGVIFR